MMHLSPSSSGTASMHTRRRTLNTNEINHLNVTNTPSNIKSSDHDITTLPDGVSTSINSHRLSTPSKRNHSSNSIRKSLPVGGLNELRKALNPNPAPAQSHVHISGNGLGSVNSKHSKRMRTPSRPPSVAYDESTPSQDTMKLSIQVHTPRATTTSSSHTQLHYDNTPSTIDTIHENQQKSGTDSNSTNNANTSHKDTVQRVVTETSTRETMHKPKRSTLHGGNRHMNSPSASYSNAMIRDTLLRRSSNEIGSEGGGGDDVSLCYELLCKTISTANSLTSSNGSYNGDSSASTSTLLKHMNNKDLHTLSKLLMIQKYSHTNTSSALPDHPTTTINVNDGDNHKESHSPIPTPNVVASTTITVSAIADVVNYIIIVLEGCVTVSSSSSSLDPSSEPSYTYTTGDLIGVEAFYALPISSIRTHTLNTVINSTAATHSDATTTAATRTNTSTILGILSFEVLQHLQTIDPCYTVKVMQFIGQSVMRNQPNHHYISTAMMSSPIPPLSRVTSNSTILSATSTPTQSLRNKPAATREEHTASDTHHSSSEISERLKTHIPLIKKWLDTEYITSLLNSSKSSSSKSSSTNNSNYIIDALRNRVHTQEQFTQTLQQQYNELKQDYRISKNLNIQNSKLLRESKQQVEQHKQLLHTSETQKQKLIDEIKELKLSVKQLGNKLDWERLQQSSSHTFDTTAAEHKNQGSLEKPDEMEEPHVTEKPMNESSFYQQQLRTLEKDKEALEQQVLTLKGELRELNDKLLLSQDYKQRYQHCEQVIQQLLLYKKHIEEREESRDIERQRLRRNLAKHITKQAVATSKLRSLGTILKHFAVGVCVKNYKLRRQLQPLLNKMMVLNTELIVEKPIQLEEVLQQIENGEDEGGEEGMSVLVNHAFSGYHTSSANPLYALKLHKEVMESSNGSTISHSPQIYDMSENGAHNGSNDEDGMSTSISHKECGGSTESISAHPHLPLPTSTPSRTHKHGRKLSMLDIESLPVSSPQATILAEQQKQQSRFINPQNQYSSGTVVSSSSHPAPDDTSTTTTHPTLSSITHTLNNPAHPYHQYAAQLKKNLKWQAQHPDLTSSTSLTSTSSSSSYHPHSQHPVVHTESMSIIVERMSENLTITREIMYGIQQQAQRWKHTADSFFHRNIDLTNVCMKHESTIKELVVISKTLQQQLQGVTNERNHLQNEWDRNRERLKNDMKKQKFLNRVHLHDTKKEVDELNSRAKDLRQQIRELESKLGYLQQPNSDNQLTAPIKVSYSPAAWYNSTGSTANPSSPSTMNGRNMIPEHVDEGGVADVNENMHMNSDEKGSNNHRESYHNKLTLVGSKPSTSTCLSDQSVRSQSSKSSSSSGRTSSELKLPSVNDKPVGQRGRMVGSDNKSFNLLSSVGMKKDGSRTAESPATQYSSKRALKEITSIYDSK